MKILWFVNQPLTENNISSTGSWLTSMAVGLSQKKNVELIIITDSEDVKSLTKIENNNWTQWVFPSIKQKHGHFPVHITDQILKLIEVASPDLIHIWGIERAWAYNITRKNCCIPILIEMQGIRYTCAQVFWGNLSPKEIRKCFSIREIIGYNSSLFSLRRKHYIWGFYEKKMLKDALYVSTQSDWCKEHISLYTSIHTKFYSSRIAVREQISESDKWSVVSSHKQIFAISNNSIPYKGLHILIKAFALFSVKFPDFKLKIAGNIGHNKPFYRKSGYTKLLINMIKQYDLSDKVVFTGAIDTSTLREELLNSAILVNPSFVETYSMVLAEGMTMGVPCVVSYAGAMPELAEHNFSALFYTPWDYVSCASQMERIIANKELAVKLSLNSIDVCNERNNKEKLVANQMYIYNDIINSHRLD